MKQSILLMLLAASAALAQNTTLAFGTPQAGELTATVPIQLTGSTAVASLQFAVPVAPAGITTTIVIGAAATEAGKTIACMTANSTQNCIVYGLNSNVVKDGAVAVVTLTGSSPQDLSLALNSLLAATLDGTAIPIPAVSPLPVSLRSKCDLNRDGKTDITDVTGALVQIIGGVACTSADITGRGKCDLLDLQKIVNSALGAACK